MVRPPGFVMRESDFEYRFLHDRIQQAAYLLVPKEHNKQQHLDVAHFLLTKAEKPGAEHTVVTAAASLPTLLLLLHDSSSHLRLGWRVQQRFDVFDIAYHFNKASGLITEPEQRLLVARLNLRAAIKAKKSMGTPLFTVSCIVSYRTLNVSLAPHAQHMTWRNGPQRKALLCFPQIAGTRCTTSHSNCTWVRLRPLPRPHRLTRNAICLTTTCAQHRTSPERVSVQAS
jgi:hypothetical protein